MTKQILELEYFIFIKSLKSLCVGSIQSKIKQ